MRKSSSIEPGLQKRRDRVRPAFGEDQTVAALVQRCDCADRVDGLPERDDCAVGQPSGEPRGAGIGGEHDRPGRERRVVGVDAPAAGDDRDLGLRRAPAPLPQLGERRCGRRVALLRRPDRSRRGGHRSRPDHQHVTAGAEQPEQQPVGCAPPGDDLVRRGQRRDRDHPVERRDEVREHARLLEPERPAVHRGQLRGQLERRQPGRLEQHLQARKA